LECTAHGLIDGHNGTRIVKLPAVVWCTEDSHESSAREELVAILNHLVCSADKVQAMLSEEPLHNIRTKREGYTPIILAPATDLLLRVRPQEVAEEACVWHIGGPDDALDLLKVAQLWRQATMHAKDLVVKYCAYRKAIEAVRECLPETNAVATLAFIVKTVYSIYGSTFMVPPKEEEILGILHLVTEQQAYGLQALLASINVVPKEKVVCLRRKPTTLEEPQQV